MRALHLLFFLFFFLVSGLLEEEAGVNDWYRANIGQLKFASFSPKLTSNKRLLYVATESSVLAALNAASGDIVWRQVLPAGDSIDLLLQDKRMLLTLSDEGSIARVWSAQDGSLLWDTATYMIPHLNSHLSTELKSIYANSQKIEQFVAQSKAETDPIEKLRTFDAVFLPKDKSSSKGEETDSNVAILNKNIVSIYDGTTGSKVGQWSGSDKDAWHFLFFKNNKLYVIGVSQQGDRLILAELNKSGQYVKQNSVALPPKIDYFSLTNNDLLLLPSGFLCVMNKEERSLSWLALEDSLTFTHTSLAFLNNPPTKIEQIGLDDLFLLHASQTRYLISIPSSRQPSQRITQAHNFADGAVVSGFHDSVKGNLIVELVANAGRKTRKITGKIYTVNEGNSNSETKLTLFQTVADQLESSSDSPIFTGHLNVYRSNNDQNPTLRVLISNTDHSISLIQNGRFLWNREEALADVQHAEFVTLPQSSVFEEDSEVDFPPIFQRVGLISGAVRNSIVGIKDLIAQLSKENAKTENGNSGKLELEQNKFGLRKIILTATRVGKLFAFDSESGEVVWHRQLFSLGEPNVHELFWRLFLVKQHHVLIISTQVLPGGKVRSAIRYLDALNGESLPLDKFSGSDQTQTAFRDGAPFLPLQFVVQETIVLPWTDPHSVHPILLVDQYLQAWLYPSKPEFYQHVEKHISQIFFYTIKVEEGIIEGHGLYQDNTKPAGILYSKSLWSVSFPPEIEKISAYAGHPDNEAIQSPVRPIGDGNSFLYKYINRNLLAVATVRRPSGQRLIPPAKTNPDPSVNVYLIDTTSGRIIDKIYHPQSVGPVHIIQSENNIYYHYWSGKNQMYELSSLELNYDATDVDDLFQADQHRFSSFSNVYPNILQQTFILRTGVRKLAVTQTHRGITEKDIIAALTTDQLLSISKKFLDPRRPVEAPTAADTAEGLVPYEKELPCTPLTTVSYNHTIHQITGIRTSSAGLESTSLILAWGLDLMFVRVTPSGTFDLLSPDFNYLFLIATVSVVAGIQIVTKIWSAKKQLAMEWA